MDVGKTAARDVAELGDRTWKSTLDSMQLEGRSLPGNYQREPRTALALSELRKTRAGASGCPLE
ncbi:hypothetical protein CGLAU_05460 [Corynebacterium glaucum]|uniref:Uncharacterized protein n=1 Tax=Corynebacterium glaucum TaxID=187491 RepID=A0A1Q2HW47_9CORY|nr:hypothetical protein CGLAU_05460 [Corynebacterium glaucum]